jgi:hypothetical protein
MHASVGLLLALAASANAYVAPGAMPLTGARSVSRPPGHALWRCRHHRLLLSSAARASQPQRSQAGGRPAPRLATMARPPPRSGKCAIAARAGLPGGPRPGRRTGRRRCIRPGLSLTVAAIV